MKNPSQSASTGDSPLSARRVRITGPRVAPAEEEALLSPSEGHLRRREMEEAVRVLMNAQLRTAVLCVLSFAVLVVATFTLVLGLSGDIPQSGQVSVFGVPVPLDWVIPGLMLYPAIVATGWVYLYRVSRRGENFTP